MDRLRDSDFAVVDLETTGFAAEGADRVVEVAILRCRPNQGVVDRLVTLVDPGRSVRASQIHGLLAGHVRGAPRFADVAPRILRLIDGAVVVAHNSRFDLSFLSAEMRRSNRVMPSGPSLCTMALCARLGVPVAGRSLDACCEHFAIRRQRAHGAEHDAQATAGLLLHLLRQAENRGWQRLSDLGCDVAPTQPSGLPAAAHPTRPRRAAVRVHQAVQRLGDTWPIEDIDQARYLELLDRVLLDRVLTISELDALAAMARRCGLDDQAVAQAHVDYVERMGRAAWIDGLLTSDEREDLLYVGRLLGAEPAADRAIRECSWES